MKLWLISQTENSGYDTYDSAVVAAHHETHARHIHPAGEGYWGNVSRPPSGTWATSPDKVTVKPIGEAAEGITPGVICASFNAG